jgi:hypothetical protein
MGQASGSGAMVVNLRFRAIMQCFCFACPLVLPGVTSAADRPAFEDEVVAVVNRNVITRSEVMEEGILILAQQQRPSDVPAELSVKFLSEVLDLIINHRVMMDEASPLGLPAVSKAERERMVLTFRRRFVSSEAYRAFLVSHRMTDEGVGDILVRHLVVERVRENYLKTLPKMSDEAVREFFGKNRSLFGAARYEDVSEAIRLRLLTKLRESSLSQWLLELRRRSEVKILVDLSASGVPEGA